MVVPLLVATLLMQQSLPAMPTEPVVSTANTDWVAANNVKVHIDSTVRVTYTLRPEEPTREVAAKFLCYHMCKGNKHLSHDKCDDSCDEPCPFPSHRRSVPIELEEPDWLRFQALAPFEERLALAGSAINDLAWLNPPSEMAFLDTLQKSLEPYYERSITLDLPHFANPCSEARRTIGYRRYSVMAHVVCESAVTKGGDLKKYTRTTDINVTSMYVPDATVVLKDEQKANCVCEDPLSWRKDPPKIDDGFPRTLHYLNLTNLPDLKPDFKEIFWEARGMGLIDHRYGDLEGDGGIYMPPGTLWEDWDEDSAYQVLVQLNGYLMLLHDGEQAHGPWVSDTEAEPLMTACTQMHKKMPDKRRMRPKPVQDQALQQIAMLSQNDLIRGLYDQVRIWIYTDNATMDEMNQVLFPKTSKSIYVRSLYDDYKVAALDTSKPEVRRLFEPSLLDCPTAPAAAQKWFVNRTALLNGKALAEYMSGPGLAMGDAAKSDSDVRGLAEIMDALASAPSPDVHRAFPKWCEALLASPKGKEIAAASKWWPAAQKAVSGG